MRFLALDGSESPKFGDKYKLNNSYNLKKDVALKMVSVFFNNEHLVGLRFTYANDSADTPIGAGYENLCGPLRSVDFALEEKEALVGVTVDQCKGYPRRISFTFMRI